MEDNHVTTFLNHSIYALSFPTLLASAFGFIEQHSSAVVGCVAIATYLTSLLFQLLNYLHRLRSDDVMAKELNAMKYSKKD